MALLLEEPSRLSTQAMEPEGRTDRNDVENLHPLIRGPAAVLALAIDQPAESPMRR